jgi:hypothetical protein
MPLVGSVRLLQLLARIGLDWTTVLQFPAGTEHFLHRVQVSLESTKLAIQ